MTIKSRMRRRWESLRSDARDFFSFLDEDTQPDFGDDEDEMDVAPAAMSLLGFAAGAGHRMELRLQRSSLPGAAAPVAACTTCGALRGASLHDNVICIACRRPWTAAVSF